MYLIHPLIALSYTCNVTVLLLLNFPSISSTKGSLLIPNILLYMQSCNIIAITTKEAKVLLGLQDRRARKILADMCDAGVLMKVGATSNLKYVLQKKTIS